MTAWLRSLPRWLPVAILACAVPSAALAQARGFRLDPVHTRVMFSIDHAGYSAAIGTVSGSTGLLVFDPADWSSARLDVSVPLRRLELGDTAWNRAARRMLDAGAHPVARFISSEVTAVDARQARACGTLYLHGQQQPLCLDVRFNRFGREPLPPFRDKAGFSATASLQRNAFGIDEWTSLVGDAVQLRIEAEAVLDEDARAELEARQR